MTDTRLQPDAVNVLFTSAGRRVELLTAFKAAFRTLGLAGTIVALDIDPLAPAFQVADRCYIAPRLNQPDYLPALVDVCRREAITLVYPLIDPDIPVLARHRTSIEATGARLNVIPEPSVDLTNDKWRTFQFFRKHDIPTPASWLPEALGDLAALSYPLFIKPRHGSASANTFRVNNADEMRFLLGYVPSPIIQEFLPGDEITNDVVCHVDGELLGVISRKRLQVRGGEVVKGVTLHNAEILAHCQTIARVLPAWGPVTVQCIMKDERPYFTEINARLGGGALLSIAAGADFPVWLLARAAGLSIDIPPLGSYHDDVYLSRYDQSYFITEAERAQLASHRL